jgi:hypothetical protein
MKIITKLPLYLGLGIFVSVILFSAVKVGEKNNLTLIKSRATTSGAILKMIYTSPDMVSVSFSGDKLVSGVDVVIEYEKNKISILPSSLLSSPQFITSGGQVNEDTGIFTFSAMAKDAAIKTGVIGTFKVVPKNKYVRETTNLKFKTGEGSSVVIDAESGKNILINTEGVQFSL